MKMIRMMMAMVTAAIIVGFEIDPFNPCAGEYDKWPMLKRSDPPTMTRTSGNSSPLI